MDYGRPGGMGGFVWPRLTPAVKVLLIVNGVVFLVNALLRGALIELCGVSWGGIQDWYGLGVLRVGTYQFVHSYLGPWHLIFNCLLLYFFGTFVEEAIGRVRMYRLYLIGGAVGGIMHIALTNAVGHDAPAVGASGSIYAIMVYAAFMAPRMRVLLIVFPIEMRWLVGVMVGVGVYMAFIALVEGVEDGTSHGGHLGGALWGFLAFRFARSRWSWLDRLREWRRQRDARSQHQRQQVLDELLEKVHREGIGALTAAERRFLDKASQDMRRK